MNDIEISDFIKNITYLIDHAKKLETLLLSFQGEMRVHSPWWIRIEEVLNPNNPDLLKSSYVVEHEKGGENE